MFDKNSSECMECEHREECEADAQENQEAVVLAMLVSSKLISDFVRKDILSIKDGKDLFLTCSDFYKSTSDAMCSIWNDLLEHDEEKIREILLTNIQNAKSENNNDLVRMVKVLHDLLDNLRVEEEAQ